VAAAYEDQVGPVVNKHPIRREPAEVEAALPVVAAQRARLAGLADELQHMGPFGDKEAEQQRQAILEYVRAWQALYETAEHHLRIGEKRTDRDRRTLQQQSDDVRKRRPDWGKVLE
jgi:hypothetical protein